MIYNYIFVQKHLSVELKVNSTLINNPFKNTTIVFALENVKKRIIPELIFSVVPGRGRSFTHGGS